MKSLVLKVLYLFQAQRIARFLTREKTLIVCYHGFVRERGKRCQGIENYQGKSLDIAAFRHQLAYFKKYYHVISLEEFLEGLRAGRRLPTNSVVLTLDDGYQSNYTLAYPVLKEFNLPAAIFVTTNFVDRQEGQWVDRLEYAIDRTSRDRLEVTIGDRSSSFELHGAAQKKISDQKLRSELKKLPRDKRDLLVGEIEQRLGQKLPNDGTTPEIYRPLEWRQILEMVEGGLVAIGSHTLSHVILTQCGPEALQEELEGSKQVVEQKTGRPCRLFAYPGGREGDFDSRTEEGLKRAGYACALTTVEGLNDAKTDPYELKRLGVYENFFEFVLCVSGILTLLSGIKQWLQPKCCR